MTTKIRAAFESQTRAIPIDLILPTRSVSTATRQSPKYRRIQASVKTIGIVEPLVVHPQSGSGKTKQYLLLDGNIRLDVLRESGATEAICLISTDDEAFTYNHKVNHISPIQEHFMIVRALDQGVSEERIAATLDIDVPAIRRKRDLLDGICPEAVDLLKNRRPAPEALRTMKKVAPMRQIEIAELMIASDNYTANYVKCLFVMTPKDQCVQPPGKEAAAFRPDDIARMEREMGVLAKDFRLIEESHGRNTLNLVVAVGYVKKLLESAAIVKFLSRKHADLLSEFQKLVETTNLDDAAESADSPSESPT